MTMGVASVLHRIYTLIILLLHNPGLLAFHISSFIHRLVYRPTTIYSLPSELLEEIASNLDFDGILCLRQTSKRLRHAADSRRVWSTLGAKYVTRYHNLPRPATVRLIDDLTTEELRRWVYARLAFDKLWKKPTLLRPRGKFFKMELPVFAKNFLLVPGGRWLIFEHSDDHFGYVDLDCDKPVLTTALVTPSKKVKEPWGQLFTTKRFLSRSRPTLEVYLAISPVHSQECSRTTGWFRIHKITIVGQGITARPHEESATYIPYLSIGSRILSVDVGDNVAIRGLLNEGETWFEAFRWRDCSSTEIVISTFKPPGSARSFVKLIGDDYALVEYPDNIALFRIPPYQCIAIDWDPKHSCNLEHPVVNPFWVYEFDQVPRYVSVEVSWLFDGKAYQVVINARDFLIGISISTPSDITTTRSTISPNPISYEQSIGKFKACIFHADGTTSRVSFGEDFGCCPCNHRGPHEKSIRASGREAKGEYTIPVFDEETGRCVIVENTGIRVGGFIPRDYLS